MARVSDVHAEGFAECPFSMAQEYVADYLRLAESGGEEAHIRVPIPYFDRFPLIRQKVAMSFGLRSDVTEPGRPHDEIGLRWSSGSRLLPDFQGTVRFRIDGVGTKIMIDGTYTPPARGLGVVFDAVLGRHIATATIQDLVAQIVANLNEREREWRRTHG